MQFENTSENRAAVRNLLQNSDVVVVFTKSDGERRIMKATLRSEAIHYEKSSDDRKQPDNEISQPVWDLGKNAWRSFRWDSLQQYERVLP